MVIHLTRSQAEWVRWALDGPISEWSDVEDLANSHGCSFEDATKAIIEAELTRLEGLDLILPDKVDPEGEFVGALLNMLEDVGPDVANGYGFEEALSRKDYAGASLITHNRVRSCRSAALKIRVAIGHGRAGE